MTPAQDSNSKPNPTAEGLRSEVDRLRTGRRMKKTGFDRISALGDILPDQFRREITIPQQQLAQLVELWEKHIPADLTQHTAIDSFQRGVLNIRADSSSIVYHLQRTLAAGALDSIRSGFKKGTLRRIKLMVDSK